MATFGTQASFERHRSQTFNFITFWIKELRTLTGILVSFSTEISMIWEQIDGNSKYSSANRRCLTFFESGLLRIAHFLFLGFLTQNQGLWERMNMRAGIDINQSGIEPS